MSHPDAPKTPSAAKAFLEAAFKPTPYSAGGKEGYSEDESGVKSGSVDRGLFESNISPVAGVQTVGGRTIESVGRHGLGESDLDETNYYRDVDAIDFGSFAVEGEGVSERDDSDTTQGAASYATEIYTGLVSAAPAGVPTIRRPIAAAEFKDSGQSYATEILAKEESGEVPVPTVAAPLAPKANVHSK